MVQKRSLALAQHPMYFIIKEDTGCAERTPPWGAPDVETYAERLERNLESLEKYPDCKFGYEWSGYELELLAEEFPNVFEKMRNLGDAGNTAFYNGTYSQPHLQTLSSESCYRQFSYGMASYRNLGLRAPVTYAHQEASVQDQVPQLLTAFGQKFAVIPGFSSTIEWIDDGEIVIRWGAGAKFLHGAEFTSWVGLDGTIIPLYLVNEANAPSVEDAVTIDIMQGLIGGPSISLLIPDLIEVDDAWMAKMKDVELVSLDDALAERIREVPPVGHARFFSNWSYIEGIRAEELSRANAAAERALLAAESVGTCAQILVGVSPVNLEGEWKTLLACQHHDVYCFCAPELKGKAIGWLREVEKRALRHADNALETIAQNIAISAADDGGGTGRTGAFVVFNPTMTPFSGTIEVETGERISGLVDTSGVSAEFELDERADSNSSIRFNAEIKGLGYTTYRYQTGSHAAVSSKPCPSEGFLFENGFYRATVSSDGTFSSLVEKSSGAELIDSSKMNGNNLAGTDSEGLSPQGTAVGRDEPWIRPERGPEFQWKVTNRGVIEQGPVTTRFRASGSLHHNIDAAVELCFSRNSPRIDITWTFVFRDACIGNFYEDDTKLRVRWPLAFDGAVSHDIGFGIVDERVGRPFTPSCWTDVSDGEKGLAYLHTGTPKHWFDESVLTNLFAWGEHTEAIGSRMWRHNWMKCFDQRLRGTHCIKCAILPHAGTWREAGIPHHAQAFLNPPLVTNVASQEGSLPNEKVILSSDERDVIATSVLSDDRGIVCRHYRTSAGAPQFASDGITLNKTSDLFGNAPQTMPAFRIAESIFSIS